MEGIHMKKRIAYLGLSYPIRFDTTINTKSWMGYSPLLGKTFPIIESPWGLMLLYDELWFLCKDVCPHNMRECSFVKYVTDLFPNIDYQKLYDAAKNMTNKPQNVYDSMDDHFRAFCQKTVYHTVTTWSTQDCQVGNLRVGAGSFPDNFLFDLLTKAKIENLSGKRIELIANGNINYEGYIAKEGIFELSKELILNGIPNYLTHYGPYHPVIDELRESKYLTDYRTWICDYHSHLQNTEIDEVKQAVEHELKSIQDRILLRYMEDHSKKTFYTTTAKTVVNTTIGAVSIPYSVVAAVNDIATDRKEMLEAQNDRWAAFVVESRNKLRHIDFKMN